MVFLASQNASRSGLAIEYRVRTEEVFCEEPLLFPWADRELFGIHGSMAPPGTQLLQSLGAQICLDNVSRDLQVAQSDLLGVNFSPRKFWT